MRIIAQAVRRESEIKLTFRLDVVGKTPHRGEVCRSLREWREVELTYPRKQANCSKNCRMDQRILLDGLQDNPRSRHPHGRADASAFREGGAKWPRIDCLSILDRYGRVRTSCGQKPRRMSL